ncbi:MAG: hypothetical protein LBU90_03535 [Bacteroidales bacterium]|jgi:hypothetical protein|nr:hypothetical protein [Bacteroidales bacterium]
MAKQSKHTDDITFEITNESNGLEISELRTDEREEQSTKTHKPMKKIILIVSILVLLIGGAIAYVLLFQPQFASQNFAFLQHKQKAIIPATSVLINNYQVITTQPLMTESQLLAQISADLNPRPQPVVIQPVPRIVTRGFIQTPTWVIVTNTFTNEAQAIRTVALNSEKGVRRGGYFWAPDYIPGAAGNFRTYIGFFDSYEDAQQRIAGEPAIADLFPNYTIQKLQ